MDLGPSPKARGQKGTVQSVGRVHRGCGTELGSPRGQWGKKESSLQNQSANLPGSWRWAQSYILLRKSRSPTLKKEM